jgi:hypothetical protein
MAIDDCGFELMAKSADVTSFFGRISAPMTMPFAWQRKPTNQFGGTAYAEQVSQLYELKLGNGA